MEKTLTSNKIKWGLENLLPYIIIISIIFIFNLLAVFGLDTLLLDDQARYSSIIHHQYPFWQQSKRDFLFPVIQYPLHYLLSVSPWLSRFLILMIWLIPCSCLFYFICNKIFKLNIIPSVTVSILPAILPEQIFIPGFIDGCYLLGSFFFTSLVLIFSVKFLKSPQKALLFFILAIAFFCISVSISEIIVFALIAISFYLFKSYGLNKKSIILVSSFTLIAIYKIIKVVFIYSIPSNTPHAILSIKEIITRIEQAVFFMSPFQEKIPPAVFIIWCCFYVLVVSSGLYLAIRWVKHKQDFEESKQGLLNIRFALSWCIWTSFPFIFMSPYFSQRYFYYASFGYYFLLIISLDLILKISPGWKKFRLAVTLIFFSGLVLFTGIQRIENISTYYKVYNSYHRFLQKELGKITFPQDTQIAIIGKSGLTTGGYWMWSSGLLQFTLKRSDISGILPYEYNLYNPFDTVMGRTYKFKMNGLDIRKPLFLFRAVDKTALEQLQYGLQWIEENNPSSQWSIIHVNPITGLAEKFIEGKGIDRYRATADSLSSRGIGLKDILWGDYSKSKLLIIKKS